MKKDQEVTLEDITLETDKDYLEARAKLHAMEVKLAEAEKNLRELQEREARASENKSGLDQKAQMLLEGRPCNPLEEFTPQIEKLRAEIHVIRRAREIAMQAVEKAIHRASLALGPALKEKYRPYIQRMAQTLRAAEEACQSERAFWTEADSKGIMMSAAIGNPMTFFGLGPLSEQDSHINQWLREAREAGFLD